MNSLRGRMHGLNSTMVRLKQVLLCVTAGLRIVSQFHYGSIKTKVKFYIEFIDALVSIPLWFD